MQPLQCTSTYSILPFPIPLTSQSSCTCTSWARSNLTLSCPNINECKYVQTILSIRSIREKPTRSFHHTLHLPNLTNSSKDDLLELQYTIPQTGLGCDDDSTGHICWASSITLSHLFFAILQRSPSEGSFFFNNKIIVELGAGSGLSSLAAAICSQPPQVSSSSTSSPLSPPSYSLVLATDHSSAYAEQTFKYNKFNGSFTLNNHPLSPRILDHLRSTSYTWGTDTGPLLYSLPPNKPIDLILLSDILYFSATFPQLISSIHALIHYSLLHLHPSFSLPPLQSTTSSILPSSFYPSVELGSVGIAADALLSNSPFLLLSHKTRDIETESVFFNSLTKYFTLYTIDTTSNILFNEMQATQLDCHDPSLSLLVALPRIRIGETAEEVNSFLLLETHWWNRLLLEANMSIRPNSDVK